MIIIIDLDYTLLNSQGILSQKNKEVLLECKNQGHKIVINSARSLIRSKDFSSEINADYLNCFHGNLVLDSCQNVIYSNEFKDFNILKLFNDFLNIHNGWIGVETIDDAYCTEEKMAKKIGAKVISMEEMSKKQIFKIIFEIDQSKKDIYKKIANKYPCSLIFNREGFFCTIMPKGSDKWNGLKILLEKFPNEKTIAFGDEISDLLTLKNVDLGVAMENSTEEIKREIKLKALSNDDDGVAKYLESFLLFK